MCSLNTYLVGLAIVEESSCFSDTYVCPYSRLCYDVLFALILANNLILRFNNIMKTWRSACFLWHVCMGEIEYKELIHFVHYHSTHVHSSSYHFFLSFLISYKLLLEFTPPFPILNDAFALFSLVACDFDNKFFSYCIMDSIRSRYQ